MYVLNRLFSKSLKMGLYDYCQLETSDDDYTLVTRDGGLVTMLELHGAFQIIGRHSFEDKLIELVEHLAGAMKKPGYRLQFVFSRDPEDSLRVVRRSTDAARRAIKSKHLDLMGLIDEREQVLSSKTAAECCYLVITTTPAVLATPAVAKQALKKRNEKAREVRSGLKPGEFGQSPFVVIDELRQRHASFTKSIYKKLSATCQTDVMKAACALRAIKAQIHGPSVSDKWVPALPGTRIPSRLLKESGYTGDASSVMYPDIGFQLFNRSPEVADEDRTLVRIGKEYHAPLLVDMPPADPGAFSGLFENIDSDIPWRFSLTIDTGHDKIRSRIGNKHTLASLLAFTSSDNRAIRDAADELMSLATDGILVTAYMAFDTWGPSADEATRRKNLLTQAIQSWGQADVVEEVGDAIDAWCDTLPAVKKTLVATPFPDELHRVFRMAPFSRPASPWESGSLLFRTVDNKLWPYLPGSSRQTSWVDLVFAPPGFGKSFFLSASNMALLTAGAQTELPMIAIIDIGFSSAAFVDLVRESLPREKRHLAKSFKLRMTPDMAINPFDTPLGCRRPLAVDRDFLVNFLELVLTPAGHKGALPRLADICSRLVDAMYEYFSDNNQPKRYTRYVDDAVDQAIADHNITAARNDEVTWWEIVDALFQAGLTHEAGLAQRHAVPNLQDATTVLTQDQTIRDLFGKATFEGGENMISFINTGISVAIENYKILSGPSMFDTGSARIVSMDLSEVAMSGSAAADKMTGVVYMLARNILCRDFYRSEDSLREIESPRYKRYHKAIIEANSQVERKLCMDEFHRTESCEPVRNQALVDIREGRKFNVQVALLSQRLQDFSPAMVEFASNVYVFSKGITEDSISEIRRRFSPEPDAMRGLRTYVNGPDPEEGSAFLYIGSVKGGSGKVEQVLRLTLGSTERWAYSTTHEDVALRRRLSAQLGLNNALRILATEHPSGSAKGYVQSRLMDAGLAADDSNIYETIVNELVVRHKTLVR